ncbi:MAG: hypothetical protein BMS9Abin29_0077 [Gemmatimonadota bacterium]|nr:MAG: hypothetical protein BMS9Abin29_0077 [Gemmatimonadota bacterium]
MRRFTPLVVALAAVPLLAFGPSDRVAPTRWALIIGINDYVNFDDEEGGDLPGAERDALAVRDVLVSRGYVEPENILMLLSLDATRANIEAGLTEWLPQRARPGDQITVFYAGHGSQMWDESGDEDDGLDETIAPTDVSRTSTELDINDDDFGAWLRALPTDNVVVVLDNCSSGTGTRAVTPFSQSRLLGRDIRQIAQPAAVARRALTEQKDETGFDPNGVNVLELSAAQPDQAAVDAYFPGEDGSEAFNGGAFTTFLVRELWRAPADMTYEEVFERVRDALKRNRFEQDPFLSEDVSFKGLPLFFLDGGESVVYEAFLPVVAASGDSAELAGGHALGITRGSTFETDDGARMVADRVTPDRVYARTLEGTVTVGDEARMTGYRFPMRPLLVGVGSIGRATADALRAQLANIESLALVDDPDAFSNLLLRRRGAVVRIVGMDGFVRDSVPAGPEGVEQIVMHLKREAAAKRLGDMENIAQSFGVKVWFAGERTTFGIGESVQFYAESDRDGYLTLVDLGTDGTVTVLFPNGADRDNRVRAGQRISFPVESEIQVLPPAGRGMARAFLTPKPLDIPLALDGDFTFGDVLLADLVADAVREAAGGVDGAPDAVRLDSWGSATLMYEIRR